MIKSLKNFILESKKESSEENKETPKSININLNFAGLENGEDKLSELKDKCDECELSYETDDNKLTVTLTASDVESSCDFITAVKDYAKTLRESSKNASDEQYAQKTKAFAKQVSEITNFKDSLTKSEEE